MMIRPIIFLPRNISKSLKGFCSKNVKYSSAPILQLSSEKYSMSRKDFALVQNSDVNYFKSILSNDRVLTDENDVMPFNIDWMKHYKGQSKVVLKPKTTKEVSDILRYCNERRLAVCPQGGNTGLVGGSVPVFDEIVLSLGLMNQVINIDEISGILVCEAGCILENLDNQVREKHLMMPLDLGAKGSCQIGGNVSTNAGGLRLLRYGNLHGSLVGIEAVLANGTVIDCLGTLKKDNTGYHLKHLFTGSEGTLGIVTKVALQCTTLPKAHTLGFFGLKSFEDVLQLYRNARSSLGEILSAFEMADQESISSTVRIFKLRNPIADYPFFVLIETQGSDESHDNEKMTRFLEKEMESGLIVDGTVTSEPTKIKSIWSIRENVPSAGHHEGYMFKYDISIPLVHYYDLIPHMKQYLGADAKIVFGYGHIGDGNLHLTIIVPEYTKQVAAKIEPYIFELVSNLNGSISAEHGIGFSKRNYIHYSKDQSAIKLMKQLKTVMDPNGILNPYKVLPDV